MILLHWGTSQFVPALEKHKYLISPHLNVKGEDWMDLIEVIFMESMICFFVSLGNPGIRECQQVPN
jgi:hypothetical protein